MLHEVSQLYSSIVIISFACSNQSQDPSLRQHVSHVAGIDVKKVFNHYQDNVIINPETVKFCVVLLCFIKERK
jgi:hypothetical protein